MTPGGPHRVLVVEDEGMSRAFLAEMLAAAGFEVLVCASAEEAATRFSQFNPHALITDIDLGEGPSGLDLLVALRKRSPRLAIVVLSNYVIPRNQRSAALADSAYLRKSQLDDPALILDTLANLLDPRVPPDVPGRGEGRLAALTEAQLEVLRFIALGLNNEEIAQRRGTTVKSVEHLVGRIFAALGLNDDPKINPRVAAARCYISEAGMPRVPPSAGRMA